MTSKVHCDICDGVVASEKAKHLLKGGYRDLVAYTYPELAAQKHMPQIDFCEECYEIFEEWLAGHRICVRT